MSDYYSALSFFDYNSIKTQVYADTPQFFSFIQYTNSVDQHIVRIFGEGTVYSCPDIIIEQPGRYQYDSTIGWVFLSTDIEVTSFFDLRKVEDRQAVIDSAILDLISGKTYNTREDTLIIFEQDQFHDNVKDQWVEEFEEEIMDKLINTMDGYAFDYEIYGRGADDDEPGVTHSSNSEEEL